eukprot:369612-Karenia_brevis.AAC.1
MKPGEAAAVAWEPLVAWPLPVDQMPVDHKPWAHLALACGVNKICICSMGCMALDDGRHEAPQAP